MARIIFLATLLVALCYTSQAAPMPEIQDDLQYGIRDKLKDLLEKLINEKAKSAALSKGGPGVQYGLLKGIGGLVDGVLKEVENTLHNSRKIVEGVLNTSDDMANNLLNEGKNKIKKVIDIVGDTLTGGQKEQDGQAEPAGLLDDIKDLLKNKINPDDLKDLPDILNREKENIKNRIESIIGN